MKTQILQLNQSTSIGPFTAGWMRVTFILLFLTLFSSGSFGQIKQWDKTFGGGDLDGLNDLQQTMDGGYILGGYSYSLISGDKTQNPIGSGDYWIVKVDAAGNKEWDKTIGGNGFDELTSLYQTSDGGYILGGWSLSASSGDKTEDPKGSFDFWVVKVDAAGNKQWDRTFGGDKVDFLSSLQQTSDGGYIVGGWSNSEISGDKTEAPKGIIDFWVLKLDAAGQKQWDRTLGGNESDQLAALQQTSDGGYILGGGSLSDVGGDKTAASQGSGDFWVVKLDAAGNQEWDKALGGNRGDVLTSLQQTSDGGYLLGGNSGSDISGDKTEASRGLLDYWVVKLDAAGEKQWDKTLGGTFQDELNAIAQAADGSYILGGYSLSGISGDKTEPTKADCCCYECPGDYWVVKLDAAGQKSWDKTLGGEADDNPSSLQATTDGGYVIGGTSSTNLSEDKTEPSRGFGDFWMVKLGNEEQVPQPIIRTFYPQQGLPGSQVTLTGRYLATATACSFNGVAAAFSVLNDTSIVATVPATATTGPITLTTSGGTITSTLHYTVQTPPPFFRTFYPQQGLPGSQVTLTGRYLTTASAISFSGVAAEFTVLNDTSIVATVPATAITGPITLTTSGGSITSILIYTVQTPPPFFRTFFPLQGLAGSQVTLTGRYLTTASAISFNGVAAEFTVLNDTSIVATVPATATTGPITLTTSGGSITSILIFTVQVPQPFFRAFYPLQGLPGSQVTLTGRHLSTTTAVSFNGAAAEFRVLNDTSVTATVPPTATTGPITLTTAGGSITSILVFDVQQPRLVAFYPLQGEPGTRVFVVGERFKTTEEVRFNDVPTTDFKVYFDFLLAAVVPAGATTGNIRVVLNGGGQATSRSVFTVLGSTPMEIADQPAQRSEKAPEATQALEVASAPYPNPFATDVTIPLVLQAPAVVQLSIYTQTGQLVNQFTTGQLGAGRQQLQWDGRDKQGRLLANGLYFYRLLINGEVRSGKLLKIDAAR